MLNRSGGTATEDVVATTIVLKGEFSPFCCVLAVLCIEKLFLLCYGMEWYAVAILFAVFLAVFLL
ncbi:hypothetical protein HN51_009085, partial [Arachis hypogaea]